MPDAPDIKTQPLSREEIAQFARTPRSIKFFENLGRDIQETIPNSISTMPSDVDTVLAVGGFTPPAAPQPLAATDTASLILSAQIFGA